MRRWYAYILRCADGTLYTGITTNLDRRVREHNAGRGAKYTRGRDPVVLAWFRACRTESAARTLEARLKRLRRPAKLALISEKATERA